VLGKACTDGNSICRRANVVDRVLIVSSIDADRMTAQSTCSAPDTPHGYDFCIAAGEMDSDEAEHAFQKPVATSKDTKKFNRKYFIEFLILSVEY
jgi:hypothetical protein